MDNQAKKFLSLCLPAFFCMLLISACQNSLTDIQKIASKEEDKPISTSKGVEVIYSDSAKVKARLLTPLMIELDDQNKPYQEMPRGVKIIFYDDSLREKGTITSDYAIRLEKENTITFRKNVVATNAQGETFKSEELIYNQTAKKLSTTKPVQIMMGNGDVMQGVGATSNESLFPWKIDKSTGIFNVDEKHLRLSSNFGLRKFKCGIIKMSPYCNQYYFLLLPLLKTPCLSYAQLNELNKPLS